MGAPFGLVTEWDNGWLGRYQGDQVGREDDQRQPALSWKATDNFSLGVGVDCQQIKATLTSNANYS